MPSRCQRSPRGGQRIIRVIGGWDEISRRESKAEWGAQIKHLNEFWGDVIVRDGAWGCIFWGGAFSKWFWSKFTLISNGFCSRKLYFCSCFMPFAGLKIGVAFTLQANCNKAIGAHDRNLLEVINTHVWCERSLLLCPLVARRECTKHFKHLQCSSCDSILLFTI